MVKFDLLKMAIHMPISPDVYKKVVAGKVYMDLNFHADIDLETISRQALLSRYHFHRLFTRIYRTTPHQYLTHKRVEQARLLLADKNLTVSEICNNVGYESIGSFSVLFKKEIGFAPQYYRNQAWLKKQQALRQPKTLIPHCFIEQCRLDDLGA